MVHFPRHQLAEHDPAVATLLDTFASRGWLEDTVIAITSDHGFHSYGRYNDLIAGEFEHRNPVLKFVVPKRFLARFPASARALGANADRLVTHRDLHHTLANLARLGGLGGEDGVHTQDAGRPDDPGTGNPAAFAGSYDLLRDEVPTDRTCDDAGIPRAWCNCFQWKGAFFSAVGLAQNASDAAVARAQADAARALPVDWHADGTSRAAAVHAAVPGLLRRSAAAGAVVGIALATCWAWARRGALLRGGSALTVAYSPVDTADGGGAGSSPGPRTTAQTCAGRVGAAAGQWRWLAGRVALGACAAGLAWALVFLLGQIYFMTDGKRLRNHYFGR